jgi:hypothetical protein
LLAEARNARPPASNPLACHPYAQVGRTPPLFLSSSPPEYTLKLELVPDDFGLDPTPFPLPVDLLEEGGHGAVAVAFDGHIFSAHVLESLMSRTRLMMRDDLLVRDLFPLCGSDQVLAGDEFITEEKRVAHHFNVLFCGKVDEFCIVDFVVIDLESISGLDQRA